MRPEYKDYMHFLTVTPAYSPKKIPGKNRFTFITKITGIPQIWTLDENQNPVPFVQTDDRVLYAAHSSLGDRTVIGMDHGGNERQQIYLYQEGERGVRPLAVSPEHFHYIGGWSPDGKSISFSSNRRHPGSFDIFTLNTETNELTTVLRSDRFCIPSGWPDDDHLLVSVGETNLNTAFYLLNIRTGERARLGDDKLSARYQSAVLSHDKKKGYVLTDAGADTLYLCRFEISSPGHLEKVLDDRKWDIETVSVSPDDRYLALTVNEGGKSIFYLYNTELNVNRLVTGIPEGVIDSVSWMDPHTLIFGLKSSTIAGDIWKYDLNTHQVRRLTFISKSATVDQLLKEADVFTYHSFDGLSIPYFCYDKQLLEKKPAVIYVHGGPEGQFRPDFHPTIQYLIQEGFAVAAPNVRGSSGYGRTYTERDDVRKRMDSVTDLAWLVEDLVRNHDVDPGRIGIVGRSYGGFMVMSAITEYPDLWAAAVDVVGITNFKTMLSHTGEWRRYLRACEYGTLENDSDFFDQIAPANHVDKIKVPLLVFHGRNDARVPTSESLELVRRMKNAGKDVRLTVFEDEGHQTEKLNNHIAMRGGAIRFFIDKLRN